MYMTMMHIREMRMGVRDAGMLMNVAVGFVTVPLEVMGMLMVLVVNMRMLVLHRFVRVLMRMMFGEVQIDADSHQCASNHQR